MDRVLTLEAAAAATGQPISRLRTWCATGKLHCDKQGGEWTIPLGEFLRVPALLEERQNAIDAGRPAAVIVPITSVTAELAAEIARRLGLAERTVTTSTLALDGTEYLLAAWKSDGTGKTPDLAPVVELVEELGGQLLDGEVSAPEAPASEPDRA